MKFITSILCCASVFTVAISAWAADSTNSVADIIQFGATNSTLIVSGRFGSGVAGGGGATSQVVLGEVFKAPKDFQTPKQIAVSWFTGKYSFSGALQLTNSYIFFLRPHNTNSDTAYRDVTDMQPFVEASDANIGVLKSQLQNR
jgi:hypothetical protein